jgi:hypothetical protein
MKIATLGFRAKTGRAIAVALLRCGTGPTYLARWDVVLYDPGLRATGQPHHEVMDLPWQDALVAVQPLEERVQAIATDMLVSVIEAVRVRGAQAMGIGVAGSPDKNLARIANAHIRAHAAEGILFRRAIEVAASRIELPWRGFSDRDLPQLAAAELRLDSAQIAATLSEIGRAAGKPWRVDERAAATAAWLVSPELPNGG